MDTTPLQEFEYLLNTVDDDIDFISHTYPIVNESLEYSYNSTLNLIEKYASNKKIVNIAIVYCAIHYLRPAFNLANPIKFKTTMSIITTSVTDIIDQLDVFQLVNNNNKKQPPCVLKRSWCHFIEKMTKSDIENVENKKKFLNIIQICHPSAKKNKNIQDVVFLNLHADYVPEEMEHFYKNGCNYRSFSSTKDLSGKNTLWKEPCVSMLNVPIFTKKTKRDSNSWFNWNGWY